LDVTPLGLQFFCLDATAASDRSWWKDRHSCPCRRLA